MKLLIAYDQVFSVTSAGAVFTRGELSLSILRRYQEVFDEIVVVGRGEWIEEKECARLSPCDGEGISFVFLPNISTPGAFFGARAQARSALEHLVDAADVTLVRLPSELGLLAAEVAHWACKRQGGDRKTWVVELVGCPFDALRHHGSLLAAAYAPLMRRRVQRAVARAPFVHYVTSSFLQRRYPSPNITASFSDVLLPDPFEALLDARGKRLRSRCAAMVFGMIGTLQVRYKGIDLAMRAMEHVGDVLGDFHFHVLGPGDPEPWRRLARARGLEGRVHFEGVLPQGEEVFRWLDTLDVYLQPSLAEALPRGLIEAMSRGLPALGSRAGEVSKLLDGSCLHDPGDWRTLAEHLVQARDFRWRWAMAQRNFEAAREFAPPHLSPLRNRWLQTIAASVLLSTPESPCLSSKNSSALSSCP